MDLDSSRRLQLRFYFRSLHLSFLLPPLLLFLAQYDFDLRHSHDPNTEGPLQLSLSFYEIKSFC